MQALLKSEFRKLLTLRSTYVVLGISLLITILFSFYITGWRFDPGTLASPTFLASQIISPVGTLGFLIAIVSILLVTHEYRYNTIMYTFTASNSRFKVLFAKFIVVSTFAILFTLVFSALSLLLTLLVFEIRGYELASQTFSWGDIIWRCFFIGFGYTAFGFIIASIVRVQVGAIVLLLMFPSTIETLLGLLLKQNFVYLPFSALGTMISSSTASETFSYGRAALVVTLYIIIGWAVSALLFVRRDAN